MPINELLKLCYNCFHKMERYRLGDAVISSAIQRFPVNIDIEQVLEKVVLINSLYGTAIFDTIKISKRICQIQFDAKIQQADISVVDDIRTGHGIRTVANNDRDLYSFATKYSSWHDPNTFPIYDNLIKKLLVHLNSDLNFHTKFSQANLKIYSLLKNVIDSLIERLQLEEMNYKQMDQGLWVYAKFLYKRDELEPDIVSEIQDALNAA
jgi:hypothetical protein